MVHFKKPINFSDNVLRNIVSLRKSLDLFDDLHDNNELSAAVATAAESRVKNHIPTDKISRGFHYSTAIDYPFESAVYLATRYSDSSYPTWYGSLDLKTTIYETTYHMLKAEMAVEGINEIVIRERAVYDIRCEAALIDLSEYQEIHASLTDPTDYNFTQQIGHHAYRKGHSGLLVPSARYHKGKNVVIFNRHVLKDPKTKCYLTYQLNLAKKEIIVERTPGKVWLRINF
jgi:RES domain-containing protein